MAKKKQKQEIDLSDSTLLVTELQRKFLLAFVERQESARTGLNAFASFLNKAEDNLFKTLFDFNPELKNYHFNYNAKTGEVTILAKKTKRKK